ncbi:polyketide synthase dehydratase domain-containing protein, partial [Streptomyces hayashii]|uniref:polyketide synthase dehydratase domain-containing protein n=1 Tax=Streptomyces hayashii TaxID=2839966 RepID=UPI00403CB69B
QGVRTFVELGPDSVLTALAQQSLPADTDCTLLPALRGGRPEARTLLGALGGLHAAGAVVDWAAYFAGSGARRTELPTYPFQESRYWPNLTGAAFGDATGLGLETAGHPLLGAAVRLAHDEGLVLTGRLSLRTHPWLADHAILGSVLLPGTAYVEMVLHAAAELGCGRLEELTVQEALVMPVEGAVLMQVRVSAPDESGRRRVTVSSRPGRAADSGDDTAPADWACHATGELAPPSATAPQAPRPLTEWPPRDATAIEVTDHYLSLTAQGYGYGPVFQGLRAAWRHGDEVYAEVVLPETVRDTAGAYGLHPALLDATLHAIGLGSFIEVSAEETAAGQGRLPFAWSDVTLHATGAGALRVRLSPAGPDAVRIDVADGTGEPVASVGSLVLRPVSASQLRPAAGTAPSDGLLRLDWTPMPADDGHAGVPAQWALLGDDGVLAGTLGAAGADVLRCEGLADVPAGALCVLPVGGADAVAVALGAVREWLADDRLADTRLLVVTRGAVVAGAGDLVSDLQAAAVWGLVRSVQAENPGRLGIVDVDDAEGSWRALTGFASWSEDQAAVRQGEVRVPRLIRSAAGDALAVPVGVEAWRLDSAERGSLDALELMAFPEAEVELAEGQVRVAVRAAG